MTCEPFRFPDGTSGIICGGRARRKAMQWPATLDDLQAAKYAFAGTGPCRACGVQMAWFITPNERKQPFSRKGNEVPKRFEPHHAVCPNRGEFTRRKKKAT